MLHVTTRLALVRMHVSPNASRYCELWTIYGVTGKMGRAEGLGFDCIAVRMNEECIAGRTGKPWHRVVVKRILTPER